MAPSCPTDNKDAGGGGRPLRLALGALPYAGGGQLLYRPALPQQLVSALLPNVHLHQQRHQPHHLQPHVSEVSHGIQKALQVQLATAGKGGRVQGASVLQRHEGFVARKQRAHDRAGGRERPNHQEAQCSG